jgi:hypothetical protein
MISEGWAFIYFAIVFLALSTAVFADLPKLWVDEGLP